MIARAHPPNHEPSFAPQCVICGTALEGPLGRLFQIAGIRRSSRNPNLCNRCNTHVQEGRIVELSVVFVDLCSFTELAHELDLECIHKVVDTFLKMVTNVLVEHGAFIDKYIGDAVMALFNVPIRCDNHAVQAVAAALEIQTEMAQLQERFDLDLSAGIGIATGWARVGQLGSTDRKDYTAIGDVVNLAARLEGQARSGEILIDSRVYQEVVADCPDVPAESLSLKGFRGPILTYRLCSATDLPQHAHVVELGSEPALRMGLGAVIFAILGAPCAAAVSIGPLAVTFGVGTLFGVASTYWGALDAPPIRFPLLVLATLGSFANLYVVWHARKLRQQAPAEGDFIVMTQLERRRTVLAVGLAVATLLVTAFELYVHVSMHSSWL